MKAAVPVGPVLDGVLDLAHRAGRGALLVGPHGVGKSQRVAEWAASRSLARVEIDLAQLESVGDLLGIPIVRDGRTQFATPIHLPEASDRREGIVQLEELLRCTPWMLATVYSFLSTGALGPGYRLPLGWTIVATANPCEPGSKYDGRALDPAALDRFVVVEVAASLDHWLRWAREGDVHRAVISFIESAGERALSDSTATPRGWEHVSKLTHAFEELEPEERNEDSFVAVLTGSVGNRWASAFLRHYLGAPQIVLSPGQVLDQWSVHRAAFLEAVDGHGRLDIAGATAARVVRFVAQRGIGERIASDSKRRANLESFWSDLPADIRERVREVLAAKGVTSLLVPDDGA